MRILGEIFATARRLRADRRGVYGVVFAVVISTLMLAVGFGLNIAQKVSVRSNLLNALDSAVTSTARDLTTGVIAEADARESVEAFLLANGGGAPFAEGERIALDTIDVDRLTNTVSASASAGFDLLFPLFGLANAQQVRVESAALYSDKKIEVAMMLDVTGSMSGYKIRDLKTAARNAVDTFLVGEDVDDPRVRVSIVPYADAVNVGELARYVHYERSYTEGEPPAYDPVMPASMRDDIDRLEDGSRRDDRCATERKGSLQFSDAGPEAAMVNRDSRLQFCPSAALHPLTADRGALNATIDGFHANGHTAGQIGVQWSWYMLSPKWREVLPAASAPAEYDEEKVAKYAILMTDGEFNTAFAGVGENQPTKGGQPGRSRQNAEQLCMEMKREGIEVFTIGFQLREPAARDVMRDCASEDTGSVRHYYEAADGEALDESFQEIARNIERLAVIR